MRLDIGAGTAPQPGFTTVDLYHPADIRAPMWAIPCPDGSVDEIWSSHALEHIAREQIGPTLREWRRILRPGGRLTLLVPDLDHCARYWMQHPGGRALDLLFGNQADDGQFHRTGWNADTLTKTLAIAGFQHVRVTAIRSHGQRTLRAVASR